MASRFISGITKKIRHAFIILTTSIKNEKLKEHQKHQKRRK